MSRWNPSTHHLLMLIMICPGDSLYVPQDKQEDHYVITYAYNECM
jgi:hypothetical protein